MSNEFVAPAVMTFDAEPPSVPVSHAHHHTPVKVEAEPAPLPETAVPRAPLKPPVFNSKLAQKAVVAALNEKPLPNVPLPALSFLDKFRTRTNHKRHPLVAAGIAMVHPMPSPWTLSFSMMKPPAAIIQKIDAELSTPQKMPERPTLPPGTPPSAVAIPGETRRNRTSKFPVRVGQITADGEPPENYPLKDGGTTFAARLSDKSSATTDIKR